MNNIVYLSICADDFGITENVSSAIIKLIKKKRITETSCIVISNSFKNDSETLMNYQNKIGIGLHLTLTDFKAFNRLKSLTINDEMPNFNKLLKSSIIKEIAPKEIEKEINFQIDVFENSLGFLPNFIDGHQHVHQLPIVRDCLIKVIKERYSENLPWVRNSYDEIFKILKRNVSILKAISIGLFGKKLKITVKENHIKSNDGFSGIYSFSNKIPYENLFKKFILDIKNNHLLMVHPGHSDEKLSKIDPVTTSRDIEYEFLSSDNFLDLLNKNNIVLKSLFTK